MAHAVLSPSSAMNWMACAAAPAMQKGLPDESTAYAEEGTKAHRLAELTVQYPVLGRVLTAAEAEERQNLVAELLKTDSDINPHIDSYVQACMRVKAELGKADFHDFATEVRLPLEPVTTEPGAFGTADFLGISDTDVWIVDFKFGAGIPVEVRCNPQLTIYALAAAAMYEDFGCEVKNIHLTIVQPRVGTPGALGSAATWHTTVDEVKNFVARAHTYGERALAIYNGQAEAAPGDFYPDDTVCRFCRAKMKCSAYTAKVKEGLKGDYEVLDAEQQPVAVTPVPEPVKAELSAIPIPTEPAALSKAYGYLPLIEQWCKEVNSCMLSRLQSGEAIPGYKLVEGRRGARKWVDDAEAEAVLKRMRIKVNDMYDMKLISPTKAEKLIKSGVIGQRQAREVQGLFTQAEGKPVVAPLSDPRPALAVAARDDFKELPDDTAQEQAQAA